MLSFFVRSSNQFKALKVLTKKDILLLEMLITVKLQVMHALDQIQMLRNVKSKQKDIHSL
jgi:hypothetical protein